MRKLTCLFVTAILVIFSASIARADLREGLVVYINFDQEGDAVKEGDTVKDLSGKGNDGVVIGEPTLVDGPKPAFGKAMEFDGVWDNNEGRGDSVEVADDDSMDVGDGDITFAMWTKHTMEDQLAVAVRPLGKLPMFGPNGPGFEITTVGVDGPNDGHPLGLFYGMSGNGPPPRQAVDADLEDIADGQWHHLVALKEGNEGRVYVDGKLKASEPLVPLNIDNDFPFMIGVSADSNPGKAHTAYNGAIDEVLFYTRALTEDEITILSTQPLVDALSVESEGKLSVTWGSIKRAY